MIDRGSVFFLCGECPICKEVDHRLQLAKESGYDPQLEYCWCDKIQTEFFLSGYCEDALKKKPKHQKKGTRKTGYSYRREMKCKHQNDLIWIIHNCGYNPAAGYEELNSSTIPVQPKNEYMWLRT